MKKRKKYIDDEPATSLVDTQLERALLVTILAHVNATGYTMTLRNVVADDDFTDDDHRNVWQWCKACIDKAQEVNIVNVYAQAQEQGQSIDVSRYIQVHGSEGDVLTLANALHTLGMKRRILEGVQDVMMSIEHDSEYLPTDAVTELEELVDTATKTLKPRVEAWRSVLGDILKQAERRANGELPQGTATGFALIDNKGGMERGELMVIAGRNSNGKTSFALCCAVGVAQRGTPVGIFSLEMTNMQLGTRIASILSGIGGETIKTAQMDNRDWDAVIAVDRDLPIYFDSMRTTDFEPLIGNIKAMVASKGVRVVVIDYMQLLRSRERERHQQMASIAHRLETLSKQLEITIVLVSQLRRNVDKDPTPRMEELKESGDIADAADSIYLIYRPERHGRDFRYPSLTKDWSNVSTQGTALLICAKNRNGAMAGEQMLGFDATTTRFYEPTSLKPFEGGGGTAEYNTPF